MLIIAGSADAQGKASRSEVAGWGYCDGIKRGWRGYHLTASNDVYTCCKYYVLRAWQNVILRRLRVFYYCVALIIPLHE